MQFLSYCYLERVYIANNDPRSVNFIDFLEKIFYFFNLKTALSKSRI